jgi:hypothetical protein
MAGARSENTLISKIAGRSLINKISHSAITGVQVLVIQTISIDWLIFAGVYILWRQRKGKRQKYHIQMLVHWLLFSGVSWNNRERVFMFDYDTKEKEHQNTRQSDLYSGASLVFLTYFNYIFLDGSF